MNYKNKYLKYKYKYLIAKDKYINQNGGILIDIKDKKYNLTIPDNLIITDESLDHRGKGSGPFGEVYKGFYDGIPVAIKIIKRSNKQKIDDEIKNYIFASENNFGPIIYYSALESVIENDKEIFIGYIVMEIIDNFEKYIIKNIEKGIEKSDLIATVTTNISELAQQLIKLKYILIDTNPGNIGFRGDQVVLLDLETLTFNDFVTLENLISLLRYGLIKKIEEKYKNKK